MIIDGTMREQKSALAFTRNVQLAAEAIEFAIEIEHQLGLVTGHLLRDQMRRFTFVVEVEESPRRQTVVVSGKINQPNSDRRQRFRS